MANLDATIEFRAPDSSYGNLYPSLLDTMELPWNRPGKDCLAKPVLSWDQRIQTKTTDKWLNVVIGVASVAAAALVCLTTYLIIKHLHKWKQREKTIVSAYENKTSDKSSLDEEPVYEEINSEHDTQNQMNEEVIYECSIIEPKTRAKQAVPDEYVQMTKINKARPKADDQRDTTYLNQVENEIIKKESKREKMESDYLEMRPKHKEVDSKHGTQNRMNKQVLNECVIIKPKTRAKQAVPDEYVQMTKINKARLEADDQRDTTYLNQVENEIIKKESEREKMESDYLDMRPKHEKDDSKHESKVVTAARRHSQPQRRHRCVSGVLGENRVSDGRENWPMERGNGVIWVMGKLTKIALKTTARGIRCSGGRANVGARAAAARLHIHTELRENYQHQKTIIT
ncbi:hypothetical protein EVAR_35524_1 [Eumeta japonica]|uniref:Uncharacterized protein n=1 Tax=Eumeta variegata TaxID=151549 RepID=A0A4C1X915_EUMVA|nr:hypothetical protein EVAR_35524_1 [Eumeta japonica]